MHLWATLYTPVQVKEVYLVQLLSQLEGHRVRSAMVFCATCRGCHLLSLVLEELAVPCAALHSHQTQGRRLAALDKWGPCPAAPCVWHPGVGPVVF